jgi:hypothetical protein
MANNAKIGGILSIICGAFGVLGLFCMLLVIVLIRYIPTDTFGLYGNSLSTTEVSNLLIVIYGAMGVGCALLGALAIVGGAYALKRRYWGLALAGAIAGVLIFFPCGIAAIIFTAISRPEFASGSTSGVIAA